MNIDKRDSIVMKNPAKAFNLYQMSPYSKCSRDDKRCDYNQAKHSPLESDNALAVKRAFLRKISDTEQK